MPKNRPLILSGKKVSLGPIAEEDAEHFYSWLNDLEVSKGISTAHILPISLRAERDWFENKTLKRQDNERLFSIIENKSKKLIGNIALMDINQVNQNAELGIVIGNKKVWGKGYGSEAITLLLKYGFSTLNLFSIHLYVAGFNKHAIRAYERVGFKENGKFRKKVFMDGSFHDLHVMDILRSEFNKIYK